MVFIVEFYAPAEGSGVVGSDVFQCIDEIKNGTHFPEGKADSETEIKGSAVVSQAAGNALLFGDIARGLQPGVELRFLLLTAFYVQCAE